MCATSSSMLAARATGRAQSRAPAVRAECAGAVGRTRVGVRHVPCQPRCTLDTRNAASRRATCVCAHPQRRQHPLVSSHTTDGRCALPCTFVRPTDAMATHAQHWHSVLGPAPQPARPPAPTPATSSMTRGARGGAAHVWRDRHRKGSALRAATPTNNCGSHLPHPAQGQCCAAHATPT